MGKRVLLSILLITSATSYGCELGEGYLVASGEVDGARKELARIGNIYEQEPTSAQAPLTPSLVLNAYWRLLADKPQEAKNAALKKVLETHFADAGYYLKRYHLAAAALIRANLNTAEIFGSPLHDAALRQDMPLCALLLRQGADPDWKPYPWEDPPIFSVKKVPLAKLFLSHKARLDIASPRRRDTVLHWVMNTNYEPLLVKLYIQNGINPLIRGGDDLTALHRLAYEARYGLIEEINEKLHYLFETLNPAQTQQLIEAQCKRVNETMSVFAILESSCNHNPNVRWLYDNLRARLKQLQNRLLAFPESKL